MSKTVFLMAAVLPAWKLEADSSFADLEGFDEQLAHERAPVRDAPAF